MEKSKFEVSELFMDIFKHFNVSDQRERMKQLTKKELYYLLICCVDKHDDEDTTCLLNFSDFATEIDDILKYSEDGTENIYISEINREISEFKEGETKIENSFFIEISLDEDNWVNSSQTNLPKPFTKEEIRDLKIGKILN